MAIKKSITLIFDRGLEAMTNAKLSDTVSGSNSIPGFALSHFLPMYDPRIDKDFINTNIFESSQTSPHLIDQEIRNAILLHTNESPSGGQIFGEPLFKTYAMGNNSVSNSYNIFKTEEVNTGSNISTLTNLYKLDFAGNNCQIVSVSGVSGVTNKRTIRNIFSDVDNTTASDVCYSKYSSSDTTALSTSPSYVENTLDNIITDNKDNLFYIIQPEHRMTYKTTMSNGISVPIMRTQLKLNEGFSSFQFNKIVVFASTFDQATGKVNSTVPFCVIYFDSVQTKLSEDYGTVSWSAYFDLTTYQFGNGIVTNYVPTNKIGSVGGIFNYSTIASTGHSLLYPGLKNITSLGGLGPNSLIEQQVKEDISKLSPTFLSSDSSFSEAYDAEYIKHNIVTLFPDKLASGTLDELANRTQTISLLSKKTGNESDPSFSGALLISRRHRYEKSGVDYEEYPNLILKNGDNNSILGTLNRIDGGILLGRGFTMDSSDISSKMPNGYSIIFNSDMNSNVIYKVGVNQQRSYYKDIFGSIIINSVSPKNSTTPVTSNSTTSPTDDATKLRTQIDYSLHSFINGESSVLSKVSFSSIIGVRNSAESYSRSGSTYTTHIYFSNIHGADNTFKDDINFSTIKGSWNYLSNIKESDITSNNLIATTIYDCIIRTGPGKGVRQQGGNTSSQKVNDILSTSTSIIFGSALNVDSITNSYINFENSIICKPTTIGSLSSKDNKFNIIYGSNINTGFSSTNTSSIYDAISYSLISGLNIYVVGSDLSIIVGHGSSDTARSSYYNTFGSLLLGTNNSHSNNKYVISTGYSNSIGSGPYVSTLMSSIIGNNNSLTSNMTHVDLIGAHNSLSSRCYNIHINGASNQIVTPSSDPQNPSATIPTGTGTSYASIIGLTNTIQSYAEYINILGSDNTIGTFKTIVPKYVSIIGSSNSITKEVTYSSIIGSSNTISTESQYNFICGTDNTYSNITDSPSEGFNIIFGQYNNIVNNGTGDVYVNSNMIFGSWEITYNNTADYNLSSSLLLGSSNFITNSTAVYSNIIGNTFEATDSKVYYSNITGRGITINKMTLSHSIINGKSLTINDTASDKTGSLFIWAPTNTNTTTQYITNSFVTVLGDLTAGTNVNPISNLFGHYGYNGYEFINSADYYTYNSSAPNTPVAAGSFSHGLVITNGDIYEYFGQKYGSGFSHWIGNTGIYIKLAGKTYELVGRHDAGGAYVLSLITTDV